MPALIPFTDTLVANAAQLNAYNPIFAQKPINQNYTTTTFTNDSALVVPVLPNATYHYRLGLWIEAANASNGGLSITWSLPAGATLPWGIWILGSTTSPGTAKTGLNVNGMSLTTSPVYYGEEGIFQTAGTAGNIQFQASQSSASGNASIITAGSFLLLKQVA